MVEEQDDGTGHPLPEGPAALYALGSERLSRGEFGEAEAALRLALAASRERGDDGLAVDALRALLRCAVFTQRLEEGLAHGTEGLRLAERAADVERMATMHNELGLVHGRLGDLERSLDHLLAGLRVRGEGSAPDGSVLNNIGNVYFELREDREALGFFEAALAASDGNARLQGIVLGNVGRARARLGDREAALEAFRMSVAVMEESGDRLYLAPALARLGEALAAVGDDQGARAALGRALSAAEAGGESAFLDEVLFTAGTFHLGRGEPDVAVKLLRRALEALPAAEISPRVEELHRVLAEAYEGIGDLEAALHHLKAHQRVSGEVIDAAATVRIRRLMMEFDVERARQQEEVIRLKNVELASAYDELRAVHEELEARNRELQRVAVEDALTGVFNRRYLDLQLPTELSRARRRGRALSVAMCDIDHFKAINDRYSHAVGDEVLRRLGELFRTLTREEDLVCRYGGEEFVVVMPETGLEGAHELVERLRAGVAAQPWDSIQPGLRVTLSVGLAEAGEVARPDDLLRAADRRLYWAKRKGRDRVESRVG